jgi:hypothetical protein
MKVSELIKMKFNMLCDGCATLAESILGNNFDGKDDLYAAATMSIVAAVQSRGCERCDANLWDMTRRMISGKFCEPGCECHKEEA